MVVVTDKYVGEKVEKVLEKGGMELGEEYGGIGGVALGEAVAAVVCPECAVAYAAYGFVAGEAAGSFIGWESGKLAAEFINDKFKEILHKGVEKVIDFVAWAGKKIARRVSNAIPEVCSFAGWLLRVLVLFGNTFYRSYLSVLTLTLNPNRCLSLISLRSSRPNVSQHTRDLTK